MKHSELCATYSIVAADAEEIGVAVQTHQMSVGAIVPWVTPGVGAAATQAVVNVSLGPMGLRLLELGVPPSRATEAVRASDPHAERRQFAMINAEGVAAGFTGGECIRVADQRLGPGYAVQANMMWRDGVVDAMAEAFETTTNSLAERMVAVLRAAQELEGDIRGMQSAALITVSTRPDTPQWARIFDLRVDESDAPLSDLERLVRMRRAQLIDDRGHELLDAGETESALERFQSARDLAPELEELAFWQAITVMEREPEYEDWARELLRASVAFESHPERWYELIERLEEVGLLSTAGLRERLQ